MGKIFTDPIVGRLVAALDAQGPALLKGKYESGDPLQVPKSALPACYIAKDHTRIKNISNAEDGSTMPYTLNVALPLTGTYGQGRLTSYDSVVDAIEARNEDLTLKPTSILYVLRKNQQLGAKLWIDLTEELEADYGFGPPEKRGFWTVEATIHITITHHQIRPGLEA